MKKREVNIFGGDDGLINLALDYRHATNQSVKCVVDMSIQDIIQSGKDFVEQFEYMSDEDWKTASHHLQRYDIKYMFTTI